MLTRSTKAMALALIAVALTGCWPDAEAPTKGVPCVVLKPKTDALRAGIIANPDTAEAVATPAADIVLGTEAVCGKTQ
jgi:hypothetical protein